jgi:hypothetical protein
MPSFVIIVCEESERKRISNLIRHGLIKTDVYQVFDTSLSIATQYITKLVQKDVSSPAAQLSILSVTKEN